MLNMIKGLNRTQVKRLKTSYSRGTFEYCMLMRFDDHTHMKLSKDYGRYIDYVNKNSGVIIPIGHAIFLLKGIEND